jgi:acylphosphatase
MSKEDNSRLHAHIKGRVQGVGYRYFTLQAAQNLDLTGWVRNLYDGRVEVVAEGDYDNLNQLLVMLRKGPVSAIVDDMDYQFTDSQDEFDQFRARTTG